MKYKLFTKTMQEIRRQRMSNTVVDFLSDDKLHVLKESTVTELRILKYKHHQNVHIQHSNAKFMQCMSRVRRYLF